MAADRGKGKLLSAFQHAKGLLIHELELQAQVPGIMDFVYRIDQIRTIMISTWIGLGILYESQVVKGNQDWVQPRQAAESI